MSNEVLPAFPIMDVATESGPTQRTDIYTSPGGSEQRVSWYTASRRRWRLRMNALRQNVAAPSPFQYQSEIDCLLWFFERHRGAGDSFYFDDGDAGKNLASYSADLTQAAWQKHIGVTVAADSVAGPDGTITADTITYDGTGTSGDWRVLQSVLEPSVNGVSYAVSAWLRALTGTLSVRLRSNLAFAAAALTTAWQRFQVVAVGDGANNLQAGVDSAVADNAAWSLYAWGWQAEPASSAGLYVPTGATPATGRYRVRFDADTLSVKKIVSQVYEVEVDLISVNA